MPDEKSAAYSEGWAMGRQDLLFEIRAVLEGKSEACGNGESCGCYAHTIIRLVLKRQRN